ncbi:hypothetical protein OIE66_37055 [Nonomuraea sp. NBC_01738]|uniref:hypothetical protein n=1 Tax=Nonomuraea sp. NBC_01738 TaxID=2976003 RepID=UPI002E1147F3|nr:hypothetical protein OIE66_37055 [Nonomuraea sp. NBC_01738]
MRVLRIFADWYWRLDKLLGGDVKPHRGQRFIAAHPVRFGLVVGAAFGGFIAVLSLIIAALGAKYVFTLFNLFFCLGGAVVVGAFFVGLGYRGRWHQRHYGYYPHESQNESCSHMERRP